MNIFIGNLDYSIEEGDIRTAFGAFGEVDSVKIITDRDTGRSKGYGFVEMSDDSAAKEAIEALNGSELNNRNITVNEARPRTENRGGGGGGRGGRGGFGGGNRGGGGRPSRPRF